MTCKHTAPFTGTITVQSPPYACIFCELARVTALVQERDEEIGRLRRDGADLVGQFNDLSRTLGEIGWPSSGVQTGVERACDALRTLHANVDRGRDEALSALVLWVEQRWDAEVKHRPMENIHRRTLDGTWKQVLAKLNELRMAGTK